MVYYSIGRFKKIIPPFNSPLLRRDAEGCPLPSSETDRLKWQVSQMKRDDLNFFKKWFSDYCGSFYSSDIEDQKNILLKEQHTLNVCENIIEISKRLSSDVSSVLLAETVALFHDIGRFPQYARYKTFRDSISVNHGLLGAETLAENNILERLPSREKEIIIKSIKFHNAFSVPKRERGDILFFIKLIRDADKLDIWRVFLEHYDGPDESKASAVGLGLPDSPGYSEDILSSLNRKKIVTLSSLKTLNDFKLLQLSWIFDLNFKPSFDLLSERQYIGRMIAHLPRTQAVNDLFLFLEEFVKTKISSL